MGRINIKHIFKGIRYNLIKLIPYKLRRPFILYFSILGLIAYYHFMNNISFQITKQPNTYLSLIGDCLKYSYDTITKFANKELIVVIVLIIIAWTTYKYCVRDEYQEDQSNNRLEKQNAKIERRSWYYHINTAISLSYAVVTILTFIPVLIGG